MTGLLLTLFCIFGAFVLMLFLMSALAVSGRISREEERRMTGGES